MVNITDSHDVLTQYIVDKLRTNYALLIAAVTGVAVPSPDDIYYGDQDKLPRTPSVCVEPLDTGRTLQGVSYRADNEFTWSIFVYHDKFQDNQLTRKECQQVAEVIVTLLHQDPQMGGNAIHSFAPSNESGYVFRAKTQYRANKISYSASTKTRLR